LRFRYSTETNGKLVKKAEVYTVDEHRINYADVDPQAVYITRELQSRGYETYIVGGAVRDLILGKKPKDFDIASSANPQRIRRIFRNSRIIGRRFRLVHIFFGSKIIEVSTFRSLIDGPTSNTFGSIDEDVQRRDFTLNALFYDPQKQVVVDYLGGMKDIRKGYIRPIIPLSHIFTDDPVRMIRAVKYAVITDFKLPMSLRLRIKKSSVLLEDISPSRLTEEIFKIIHSPHVDKIIEALDDLGLYQYLQPGACELFKSNPGFRKRYFKTLELLAKNSHGGFKEASQAEALLALIRTYMEDISPWNDPSLQPASQMDILKNSFNLARKFVLPMNPPKVYLFNAIKILLLENGIIIKKMRLRKRHKKPLQENKKKKDPFPR